jgi:hypothetical protein
MEVQLIIFAVATMMVLYIVDPKATKAMMIYPLIGLIYVLLGILKVVNFILFDIWKIKK